MNLKVECMYRIKAIKKGINMYSVHVTGNMETYLTINIQIS